MAKTPKIPLTDWQRGVLLDESNWRFIVASRQSGKSHVLAADAIVPSVERPRNLEILLSAGDRQSLELMEKVKMQCQALGVASQELEGFFQDTGILQRTVTFPNGSRIIGLPANPATARGYSGNVKLDEFGLHKDSREIWAALAPTATRGFRVTVSSTFKGTENKFYEIAKELGLHTGERPERQPVRAGVWSGHWVDIHMSAEQTRKALGIRIDIEGLRQAIGDEEVWLQEFCNVPMSSAENFFPVDLVMACEDASAASVDWDGEGGEDFFAGMDIGRRKDRSVIWIVKREGERNVTRGVLTMERMAFAEQLAVARQVAANVRRMDVDATGIGAMLAETLHVEYPWVEQVTFSAPVKERMAVNVKKRLEERTLVLPESRETRRAFGAIKRTVGPTGGMRFDAARTDSGHADEFWACALADAAAGEAAAYTPLSEGALVGQTVMGGLGERVF